MSSTFTPSASGPKGTFVGHEGLAMSAIFACFSCRFRKMGHASVHIVHIWKQRVQATVCL